MKYTLLISALFIATASCSYSIPHGVSSTKVSGLPAYTIVGDVKVEECSMSSIFSSKEARYDNSFANAQSRAQGLGGDAIINYEIIKTDYLITPFYSKDCYTIVGTAVKFTGGGSSAAATPAPSESPQ